MTTQAFENLVVENKEFLKPFALNLTQHEEDARDLVQDTLYRAFLNSARFEDNTNIRGWLFTIMRNLFINGYRRKKRFMKVSSEDSQDYYLFHKSKIVLNEGLMNSGINEIYKQLNSLPEILKTAFEMHYTGYKYTEIADELNEPLGTIKSRIYMAKKILTNKIKRY